MDAAKNHLTSVFACVTSLRRLPDWRHITQVREAIAASWIFCEVFHNASRSLRHSQGTPNLFELLTSRGEGVIIWFQLLALHQCLSPARAKTCSLLLATLFRDWLCFSTFSAARQNETLWNNAVCIYSFGCRVFLWRVSSYNSSVGAASNENKQ